jgi:7,8-dihydropterin-6-yl-methyl-4-(beta-D-ribofuranosyl)aminobenzene 5'-phosphate synthase
MTIQVLLENTTTRNDMMTEHGLSLLITACGRRILFDMGQTDRFAQNARALGIDLCSVDTAIVSHGHYDHGGGLATFLELNDHAPVYIRREAFYPYYNGTEKYIGLDPALASHPRLVFTDDIQKLDNGLTLYSCNEQDRRTPISGLELKEKKGDCFTQDAFLHEHYLVIEEDGKRVLISGCSHKGILDLAAWFKPDILIGGFHFSKITKEDVLIEAA